MKIIEDAARFTPPDEGPNHWAERFRVPDLSVGTYSIPAGGTDDQAPQHEDEIYVVIGGRASRHHPARVPGGRAGGATSTLSECRLPRPGGMAGRRFGRRLGLAVRGGRVSCSEGVEQSRRWGQARGTHCGHVRA